MSQTLSVIAGRYRLESLIGEGGMASVWRAKDLTLARPVAVKLLFARDDRDHEALVARFLREARIAAAVQHRNVIQIVDFGTTDVGQPYMVMELLEGESLGDRLHRQKQLPLPELVHIASMTLRGLAAVHGAGIIHRDLKPDNIFLKEETSVVYPKILDFGISRSVEPASGRRSALTTKEGIIVGTPEYMSPEQARGIKDIDHRTDLYSMGVIMYQALSGKLPFASENVGDLIIKIVTGTAPPIGELVPGLPKGLADVIARAMAHAPADRFSDATQMQDALVEAAEAALGEGTRRSLSDRPPATLSIPTAPRASRDRPPLLSREFPLAAGEEEVKVDTIDPVTLPKVASPRPVAAVSQPTTGELAEQLTGKPRRWAWALGGLAVIAGIVAGVSWSAGPEPSATPIATPIAAAPGQPSATAAPPPTAAAGTLQVRLRGVPSDAVITVDGNLMGSADFELPKDGRSRTIVVSEAGKAPWQAVYAAQADQSYDVVLGEATPAAVGGGTTARPSAGVAASTPGARKPKRAQKSGAPTALRHLDF